MKAKLWGFVGENGCVNTYDFGGVSMGDDPYEDARAKVQSVLVPTAAEIIKLYPRGWEVMWPDHTISRYPTEEVAIAAIKMRM